MTVARNVGREHSDLAVRDLARRTSVLPRHCARCPAVLEKAGFVDYEYRIVIRQMLDDIVAYNIAQGIGVPMPATEDCLLPPWAGVRYRMRSGQDLLRLSLSHPTWVTRQMSALRRFCCRSELR